MIKFLELEIALLYYSNAISNYLCINIKTEFYL